jgi:HEAT repeat protein
MDQDILGEIESALAEPTREHFLRVMRGLRRCKEASEEDRSHLEGLLACGGISTWMRRELVRLLQALAMKRKDVEAWGFLRKLRAEDAQWSFEIGERITIAEKRDLEGSQRAWQRLLSALFASFSEERASLFGEEKDAEWVGRWQQFLQWMAHEGALDAAGEEMRARMREIAASVLMGAEDTLLRRRASWLLQAVGLGGIAEEVIVQGLASEDPQIASHLALALSKEESLSEAIQEALLVGLGSESFAVRGYALDALRQHQYPLEGACFARVLAMADATEPWERCIAIEALGQLTEGQDIDDALWQRALLDEDEGIALEAMKALRRWNRPLTPFFPQLDALLRSPSWRRRQNAARTIQEAKSEAALLLPAMRHALEDPRWRVRRSLLLGMIRIDASASEALESFLLSASDAHWQVRLVAADGLGRSREQAATRVEALAGILRRDDNWQTRHAAALALAEMREAMPPALPILRDALLDPAPQVARVVAKALQKMIPYTEEAREVLEAFAAAGDEDIHRICRGLLLHASTPA